MNAKRLGTVLQQLKIEDVGAGFPNEAAVTHGDLVDQFNELERQAISAGIATNRQKRMKAVSIALSRLDTGEYGLCMQCGSAIEARRLKAVPWALLCLACQSMSEQDF